MAKQTISGFIVYHTESYWADDERFQFRRYDPRLDETEKGAIFVCEHSFTVEVPDDFDPRPGQLSALQARRRKVRADLAAAVKAIDDRIASLLALENAS